jgi:hypothetical protein
LGSYSDAHKESIELIKALGSVVNPIEFDQLEKMGGPIIFPVNNIGSAAMMKQ